MKKLKHPILLLTLLMILPMSKVFSQFDDNYWTALFSYKRIRDYELGVGISSLHPLNLSKPFVGLHIKRGVKDYFDTEILGKDYQEFDYLSVSYFFSRATHTSGSFRALPIIDTLMLNPIDVPYDLWKTINFFTLDFGSDYKLYKSYTGFGFYCGWLWGLIFSRVTENYKISDYNKEYFALQTPTNWKENKKESFIGLKFGLTLGTSLDVKKNEYEYNAIYLELSPVLYVYGGEPLGPKPINYFFISLNLGYRFRYSK